MIEDKLDQDQRIRFECLAQANVGNRPAMGESAKAIIVRAAAFEEYVRNGAQSAQESPPA